MMSGRPTASRGAGPTGAPHAQSRRSPLLTALGAALTVRAASPGAATAAQPAADRGTWRWYKGNTHTHTLQSDGDTTPDEVTRWYKERGYHFLVLSDHNVLTPVAELASMHAVPEQFLMVPGEEVTDAFGKKPLHVNGLNVERLVEPQHGGSVAETVQRNVDAIRAARGVPHINHPNYGWAITAAELIVRNATACSRSTTAIRW